MTLSAGKRRVSRARGGNYVSIQSCSAILSMVWLSPTPYIGMAQYYPIDMAQSYPHTLVWLSPTPYIGMAQSYPHTLVWLSPTPYIGMAQSYPIHWYGSVLPHTLVWLSPTPYIGMAQSYPIHWYGSVLPHTLGAWLTAVMLRQQYEYCVIPECCKTTKFRV